MILIKNEDFDIAKIAASGQCFRLTETAPGLFRLAAAGRLLFIRAEADGAVLLCPEEEAPFWRHYFALDEDYAAFRAAIPPEDHFLSEAACYGRGIRILRQEPWETLVTFIISQRKNIPAIRSCVEELCRRWGDPLEDGPAPLCTFPTPEKLASLPNEALCSCALGYRTDYVRQAARLVAEGSLDLSAIYRLDDDALREALCAVPGVGPKVASCVMLFGYHRLTGFPRDVWINRIIEEEYSGCFPLERYAGFEGVIQQYMFYYGRSRGRAELAAIR